MESYDRALETDPHDGRAWGRKGSILSALDRPAEAIECFDEALKRASLFDDMGWVYTEKAYALTALGRYEEAIASAREAARVDPEDPDTLLAEGWALESRGGYKEAEQLYQQALRLNPQFYDALYRLGHLYSERLFNFNRALLYSRRLADLYPDYSSLEAYSYDLITNRRYTEAQKTAAKALRKAVTPLERCVTRLLAMVATSLADKPEGDRNLGRLLTELARLEDEPQGEFVFDGLSRAIAKSRANTRTKFLLLTLVDVVAGEVARDRLSFFTEVKKGRKREKKRRVTS